MTSTPYWVDSPKDWSKGVLGPFALAGLVSVEVDDVGRQLDRKKPHGKSGGHIKDKGYKPCKVKVTVVYWTREHHQWWSENLSKMNPRRENSTKEPLVFRHPAVDEFDLGPWIIASLKAGMPSSKKGRKIEIILEEYFEKPKEVKKGTGKVVQPATEDRLKQRVSNSLITERDASGDTTMPWDSLSNVPNDPTKEIEDPTEHQALKNAIGDITGTSRE